MSSPQAAQLSQMIQQKVSEMKKLCQGVDEKTASRAPSGRWSPKEILSHLCGPEGVGVLSSIHAILKQDTPRLDIEAENPFFTEKRSKMTMAQLLGEFEKEYGGIAEVVKGLSEEQLGRRARVPLLKETQIGDHPTLALWVQALGEYHVKFHIDHMGEILHALGVDPAGTAEKKAKR